MDSCKGKDCPPPERPPRPVCFNVYCTYQGDEQQGAKKHYDRCTAAASFVHLVADDGDEVFDNSADSSNPAFEVQCDSQVLYDGPAHRYTDRLGSRIQGIPGPYPAIVLPVGALTELRHYSESSLEVDDQRLSGDCYVYTGPQ